MTKELKTQDDGALLPRLTLMVAKIAEVLHWCLVAAMLAVTLATIIRPEPVTQWVAEHSDGILSCYGFEIAVTGAGETVMPGIMIAFTLGSAVVLSLMAMIFRNVYLILRTAKGKTWFAKGNTPFQQNIVRMFREIGIFFIAVAVMSLVSEVIVNIVGGELNTGFNYMSCFMGLVFICISQFFNYGTRLEKDLDGLV